MLCAHTLVPALIPNCGSEHLHGSQSTVYHAGGCSGSGDFTLAPSSRWVHQQCLRPATMKPLMYFSWCSLHCSALLYVMLFPFLPFHFPVCQAENRWQQPPQFFMSLGLADKTDLTYICMTLCIAPVPSNWISA